MTAMNCYESAGSFRVLSEDEMHAVVGGKAKAAAAPSKPVSGKVFEIEDFSFDVE
jgi:hypothetical protein